MTVFVNMPGGCLELRCDVCEKRKFVAPHPNCEVQMLRDIAYRVGNWDWSYVRENGEIKDCCPVCLGVIPDPDVRAQIPRMK